MAWPQIERPRGAELHDQEPRASGLGSRHLHVFLVNNCTSSHKAACFCAYSCMAAVVTCVEGLLTRPALLTQGFLRGFSKSLGSSRAEGTAPQRWRQVVRTDPVCHCGSWQQAFQFWREIPFLLALVQGVLCTAEQQQVTRVNMLATPGLRAITQLLKQLS